MQALIAENAITCNYSIMANFLGSLILSGLSIFAASSQADKLRRKEEEERRRLDRERRYGDLREEAIQIRDFQKREQDRKSLLTSGRAGTIQGSTVITGGMNAEPLFAKSRKSDSLLTSGFANQPLMGG